VATRGITENNALKFLTIPPNSKYGNANSIYILQLDHTTMVVPSGMCMSAVLMTLFVSVSCFSFTFLCFIFISLIFSLLQDTLVVTIIRIYTVVMIHFTMRTTIGRTAKEDLHQIVADYFKPDDVVVAVNDPTKEAIECEEKAKDQGPGTLGLLFL
jgi:hypothetical protein